MAKTEIVPSLIIGIGGTGCDIVRETKKRIRKVYGDLPIIQYLVFDTDYNKVDGVIEDAEFIKLTVEYADEFIKGIDHYPELKAWWPTDLHHIGDVGEGTKQIRPIGRFVLFRNIAKIRNIIEAREVFIKQPNHIVEVESAGYSVKRDFKVFVVNSLGGGTGSGMFLDLAFNIRDVVKGCNVSGYTILPDVFKMGERNRASIAANTYAALKELDYYMNEAAGPEHFFNCNYGSVDISASKKPFDRYYIIDSETEDHFTKIKYEDVAQVIANAIFLDLTSDLGLTANAMTANIDFDLHECLDQKNKMYVKAYSSTGIYSMYYPTREIKKACVYRYAASLVEEITRPIEGFKDITASTLNDITTRSEVNCEIADLEKLFSTVKFEVPAEIGGSNIDTIEDDNLVEQLSEWSMGEEKKIEGKIAVEIKNMRTESVKKVRNYLENEIEVVVEDSSKGISVGKEIIDKLEDYVMGHLRELSGEEGELGEEGQIAKTEKEVNVLKKLKETTQNDLKELIKSTLVLFKRDKIKQYAKTHLDACVKYFNKYIDLLKDKEIKVFYVEVHSVLSELRGNLNEIERKLELLKKDFAAKKVKMLHRLHTEASDFQLEKWIGGTEENIERIYAKHKRPLRDAKNEVCQNVLYDWKDYDSEDIRTALLKVSEKQYTNLRLKIIDVLPPDLTGEIGDIIEKSRVQITGSGIGVRRRFELSEMAKMVNILGVQEEIRDKVDDIVNNPDIKVVATKDEIRISNVIYKHVIPLVGMEPVVRLKRAYDEVIETKERPLHIIESSNLEEII